MNRRKRQTALYQVQNRERHEIHPARPRGTVQHLQIRKTPAQARCAQVASARVTRVHMKIDAAERLPHLLLSALTGQIRPDWSERRQRVGLHESYSVAWRMSSRV